jgi:propionyl-CoA carboxylase alpha chain
MVIESMKMEIGVAAPVDGVVSEIVVNEGQAVEMGKPMIKFDL